MMFKRVLIVEDHESTSISVTKTLGDLGVDSIAYTFYCDDALMLIRKSMNDDQPYDLLITDLSFEEDHREQKLGGGAELIIAAKAIHPSLKVLVFSAEHKVSIVEALFTDLGINAYVRKARNDSKHLKVAIQDIFNNKTYISTDVKLALKQKNAYEFSDFDIIIISLLSKGTLQKDIPHYLQKNKIKPSGLSSVEKRLNLMKEELAFSKNEQLVAYCKDFGII
jgi:two-component system capsular synthesis response regulator RcsB